MTDYDVVVVGSGIGGLCSAILLGSAGLSVLVLERADSAGGKAGALTIDGVEVDTGPSVLTLPHVFDEVFQAAGMSRQKELTLTEPSPAFRYCYHDGTALDVYANIEDTLASVRSALGTEAAEELENYLKYAARIWEAAAPHFVFSEAPNLSTLLLGGPARWKAVSRIDPFRTLSSAIDEKVSSSPLRMLLRRYATYNGSDVRTAPATLGCIAHVELALGGYGVRGGMIELVRALERAARKVGVHFRFDCPVSRITQDGHRITGVITENGERFRTRHVVANADVAHLTEDLLDSPSKATHSRVLSMSAHTGILRARRREVPRPAHTVLFPADYEAEFSDIFDHKRVPCDPTIYLCAQESCHGRQGWKQDEPIFCMINAPALESFEGQEDSASVRRRMLTRLREHGLAGPEDATVWWRSPAELAARFPGSRGSLYGAASNSMNAAFQRPNNRFGKISGLYLASGSAHPGGGVPMVALSGKQAARQLLGDRRGAA